LAIMAVVVAGGMLVSGGAVSIPAKGVRIIAGLAPWSLIGLVPLLGAVLIAWWLRQSNRPAVVWTLSAVAILFVGLVAAFPAMLVDAAKAPKPLVEMAGAFQPDRDIRLASLDYTQESVTFYARRRVERMKSPEAALAFLAMPRPGYLFVPAVIWEERLAPHAEGVRVAARRYDFYRNTDIVVITNDGAGP
jgi:hypothetical protein